MIQLAEGRLVWQGHLGETDPKWLSNLGIKMHLKTKVAPQSIKRVFVHSYRNIYLLVLEIEPYKKSWMMFLFHCDCFLWLNCSYNVIMI